MARRIALLVALVVSVFIAIAARVVVGVAGEALPPFAVTLIDLSPLLVIALFVVNVRASRDQSGPARSYRRHG